MGRLGQGGPSLEVTDFLGNPEFTPRPHLLPSALYVMTHSILIGRDYFLLCHHCHITDGEAKAELRSAEPRVTQAMWLLQPHSPLLRAQAKPSLGEGGPQSPR